MVRELQKRENRLVQYFRETRAELRKVVWPTRAEARNLTAIVVGTLVAMSIFLGAVDYFFQKLIAFLIAAPH